MTGREYFDIGVFVGLCAGFILSGLFQVFSRKYEIHEEEPEIEEQWDEEIAEEFEGE